MSDPFVAEIRLGGFNFAPKGWAFCDGRLLPISQNTALFSLLQPPLQQQLQALWAQLQARVQECKACNLRNCQLIMEQAEVMRSVIAGSSQPDIYVPF